MTFLNSSGTEGVKLGKNRNFEWGKNIKMTSSINVDEEKLYKKLINELNTLERKKQQVTSELHRIRDQIRYLPEKSDYRIHCEFYYQHLLKRIQQERNEEKKNQGTTQRDEKDNQNLLILLQNESSISMIEETILTKKNPAFINIGSEGRKQIIIKLLHFKNKFTSEGDILQFINEEIDTINTTIKEIKASNDRKTVLLNLKKLNLEWFSKQSAQVQGIISEKLLQQTLPANLNLSTLDGKLRELLEGIEGLTTMPIELLNNKQM
ncbi:hypothetical protein [Bacillus sp. Marseille-P3661]|uniref:hypothetical protein n=1 Tax=Bacillus sp. Marseille-P3661 TaxID=1936234 RepID=UPI000C83DAB5|nr:hypothetical protein [Bacillus sp. Marseille-P3661]